MTQYIISSGAVSRLLDLLPGDSLVVERGGTAIKTDIGANAAIYVQNGGIVRGTVVARGGAQFLMSGGIGLQTTVEAGGFAVVEPGGHEFTTVLGGGHLVSTGIFVATTSNFHIATHDGGKPDLLAGETEYVLPQGHVLDTEVKGTLRVFRGGKASASVIDAGGHEIVSAGGSSLADVVDSGGSLTVQNGGTASGGQVAAGGTLTIASGGLVTAADITSGARYVFSNGSTLSDSTLVGGSGPYSFIIGGVTMIGDSITGNLVFTDGTATNLVLNSAHLELDAGAYVDGVTINGGSDVEIGGGIPGPGSSADNVTVNAGGTVWVFAGNGIGDLRLAVGGTFAMTFESNEGYQLNSISFDYATDVLTFSGSVPDDPMVVGSVQMVGDYTGEQFNITQGSVPNSVDITVSPTAAPSAARMTLTSAGNPAAFHAGDFRLPTAIPADFGWNTQSAAHPASPAAPGAATRLGNHPFPDMPSAHQLLLHQP